VPGKLVGTVGDDLEFTVALIDFDTGAVTGTGATIVATVGVSVVSVVGNANDYSVHAVPQSAW